MLLFVLSFVLRPTACHLISLAVMESKNKLEALAIIYCFGVDDLVPKNCTLLLRNE